MENNRFFSLKEAVDMIAEDDDIFNADIVVFPPEVVNDQSDCEDFEENDLTVNIDMPQDICGTVEVHYEIDKVKTGNKLHSQLSNGKNKILKSKKQNIPVNWKRLKPKYCSTPKDDQNLKISHLIGCLADKTETEMFQEFFDDTVIAHIIDQSQIYAQQKNRHGFELKSYQLQHPRVTSDHYILKHPEGRRLRC
ncbi:hypothetical protein HELRODRAFT_177784 [Helobdella robusta]|uniref:PiggyBac transposable element-derived protein domain-containing protein n=1 Tax=Helobdella robusta TaxID=6412 RepID=T1FC94_HELRO|nr:hypothetical protein HELRODRAFT_177784 [Helobdella robusta]ESN97724.1 hypothetical protein HELRODRAFT_177784 [Helobdella robusta]